MQQKGNSNCFELCECCNNMVQMSEYVLEKHQRTYLLLTDSPLCVVMYLNTAQVQQQTFQDTHFTDHIRSNYPEQIQNGLETIVNMP